MEREVEKMLKQLVLSKKLAEKRAAIAAIEEAARGYAEERTKLQTREAELAAALEEVTEETTEEDKKIVEDSISVYEADDNSLTEKEKQNAEEKEGLESEIRKLQDELDALNKKSEPKPATENNERNRKESFMENRTKFYGMTVEERNKFFAADQVKNFLGEIRAIKTRGITGGSLTVPEEFFGLLRNNMDKYSKLLKYVTVKSVSGTSRQVINGAVPEGVWIEATGALNDLDMSFNQVELDGYVIGGIIYVHNTLLEDSDIALGAEILEQLGQALGTGIDRSILYGTGSKMPLGIATRLAQTSQPDKWGANAPEWTDLHTSNVKKLNINGTTGAAFYASLISALGTASPNYSDGKCFWAMNRKTHIALMTKALAFDAAAALLAGVNNQMPIIGGDIVVLEMVGDNEIIGGYGSVYLLAERAGAKLDSSEHAKFREMMTGFRGYARYDGMPVFGEAFVMVNFNNTDVVTASTFPTDYENIGLGTLIVTAEEGTDVGDTELSVGGTIEAVTPTLVYKLGIITVKAGQKVKGFTAMPADFEITAASGQTITVVELDENDRAVSAGNVKAVAKASTGS